jgi:hypothetical protein
MADQQAKSREGVGAREHYGALCAKIVARAWADEAFRAQLLAHPAKVLSEHGFYPAEYLDVKVVSEGSAPVLEFPLPPRPANLEAQTVHHVLKLSGHTKCHPLFCCGKTKPHY